MVSKPPALYRLSRLLRRLSIVALVLIIVYIGTAVYSASKLNPGDINKANSTTSILPNGTVQIAGAINLTNPGFYPINSFTLTAKVHLPSGRLLSAGTSAPVTVGPASTSQIPVIFNFPTNFSGAEQRLLTHDEQLPSQIWVNVTYASILTAALSIGTNVSWKAPFYGFNATVGTPIPNGNGTVTIPVTISFDNHAEIGATGTLTFTILSSGNTSCGSASLPVDDAAGSHFNHEVDVIGQSGCNPHGGAVHGKFSGIPWSFTLPAESIP